MAALLALRAPDPSEAPRADDSVERTGIVDAWHVLANGTVTVRLNGRAKDQAFSQWFVTPGDKTDTTRFEHQVLSTILSFVATRQELTFTYAAKFDKSDKTGKTIKDAIPIEAMMWNVLPSEEREREKKGGTTTTRRSG